MTNLCGCGCGQETRLVGYNCLPRGEVKGAHRKYVHGHNGKGEQNGKWVGGKAKYAACHHRVYALKGRAERCEVCGLCDPTKVYDWANLTGNYLDPKDFKQMCRSCHKNYDYARERQNRSSRPKFNSEEGTL